MQNHTCSDCGPAPINHRLAYFSVFSDWIFLPVIQILISVRRHVVAPLLLPLRFDRWALPVFRLLAKLHLGTVNEKLDEKNSLRTRALWESAEKLGIKIYEFRLFGRALETFVAVYKDQSKLFYEIPRPNVPLSSGFWWIDDKPLMRKYLGSRQAVRHRPLEAAFEGSNPSSPAISQSLQTNNMNRTRYYYVF
jgi:hypothetical protein